MSLSRRQVGYINSRVRVVHQLLTDLRHQVDPKPPGTRGQIVEQFDRVAQELSVIMVLTDQED